MAKKKKNETRETWIAFAICLVILAVIICVIVIGRSDDTTEPVRETMSTEFMEKAPPCPFDVEGFETVAGCPLGALNDSLSLTCIGTYQNSLAAIVENVGDEMVTSAELKINYGGMDAFFNITDLPAGSSMLVVEMQQMDYAPEMEFKTPLVLGFTTADETVKTSYASDFEITVDNGLLTIENCSDRDFSDPVEIDCKLLLQEGLYFGTTRPLATQGLFARGESRYFTFEEGWQIICLRYS